MQQLEIIPPDTEPLRLEAVGLVERAKRFEITTPADLQTASNELVAAARIRKGFEKLFEEPCRKADEAHRSLTKLRGQLVGIPGEAETIYRRKIGAYKAEEDKARREEQERIQKQLRRQAEDERLAEASALAETGHQAEAEQLLERPVLAPVVEIPRTATPGVSTRRKWNWRFLDYGASVKREFMVPDEAKIRKTVAALGPDAAGLIGGIEVYEDTIVAVRTSN